MSCSIWCWGHGVGRDDQCWKTGAQSDAGDKFGMKAALNPLQPQSLVPASIKGYYYQFAVSALRWLQLGRYERIVFEGDDDIVRYRDSASREENFTTYEQVKDLTKPVTTADTKVRKTLERFLIIYVNRRLRDAESRLLFIFTTTALLKRQLSAKSIDVLADWHDPEKRPSVIDEFRRRLFADCEKKGAQAIDPDLLSAIQWLDESPGRWSGFFDVVRLDFDAPDLAETLQLIKSSLTSRPKARDLADDLTLRLVNEVLRASSEAKPAERTKDRKDLEELLRGAYKDLAVWRDSSEASNLRQILDETINLESILKDPWLDLSLDIVRDRPGKLLPAYYETVPFDSESRREELRDLESWCINRADRSLWLIHGEGGSGKTRLMLEWCQRLEEDHGWHAGFLDPKVALAEPAALRPIFKGLAPRLIVVDYAEQHPDAAQRLIEQLSERKSGPKIRLVLLTRRVPDWWWNLRRRSDALDDLLSASSSRLLPPLFCQGPARANALSEAVQVFSDLLGKEPPIGDLKVDLDDRKFNNALFLYMEALSIVYGDAPERRYDILETILTHERRFWQKEIDALNLDKTGREALEDAIGPLISAVTLLKEVPSSLDAQNLVNAITNDGGLQLDDLRLKPVLLSVLRRICATGNDSFAALQPDLLGEQLIESTLKEHVGDRGLRGPMLLTRVFEGIQDTKALLNLTTTTMRLLLRRGANTDPGVGRGHLEHRLQWLATKRGRD